ncbi:unnamed protein product, partial [Candidula unifasciata]
EPSDSSSDIENGTKETSQTQDNEKSGMASVIARILSKDISKSKRVLLAKGKTSQEIFKDISERKRQREESENPNVKSKHLKHEKLNDVAKEEKRKIWESMGRRIPSVLDNPREVKLRRIATQGMVQLFRLVSQERGIDKRKGHGWLKVKRYRLKGKA